MATESPKRALLVMDFQQVIVERVTSDPGLLGRTKAVIDAARAATIPVIYVIVRFRDGYPEVSARNQSFSALKANAFPMTESDPATDVHEAVAPLPGEVVVTKRRVGAFSGSDLDVVLRAAEAQELILAGIATSGVVLSTLRLAADLDFGLVVLSDCCADGDAEVHRVLMEKVFPRQARVMTGEEWQAQIK